MDSMQTFIQYKNLCIQATCPLRPPVHWGHLSIEGNCLMWFLFIGQLGGHFAQVWLFALGIVLNYVPDVTNKLKSFRDIDNTFRKTAKFN